MGTLKLVSVRFEQVYSGLVKCIMTEENKTETLCVGPIWSHNDFLDRQDELTKFGKEKLGPNWEIEGNWWSEYGTSYVIYKRNSVAEEVKTDPVCVESVDIECDSSNVEKANTEKFNNNRFAILVFIIIMTVDF